MRFRGFLIAFAVGVVLVSSIGAGAFFLSNPNKSDSPPIFESGKQALFSLFSKEGRKHDDPTRLTGIGDPPATTTSFLTGTEVKNAEAEKFVAVMIDLAPAARPLFRGVNAARILFEMPAEGGVPRIMAIFSSENLPEEVGPVRSARDYFVEIAEGIAGGYVHAGGSPDALEMLYSTAMANFDERNNGFMRDKDLARPHNLFVLPPEIIETVKPSAATTPIFAYSKSLPISPLAQNARRIDVDISTRTHAIAWNYDAEQNCYKREQERETMAFCPQNVVVLATDISLVPGDEKGRLNARVIGEGKGWLFRDGLAFAVNWQRPTKGVFVLTDELQNPVPLLPGQTFFEILDTIDKVGFSSLE